MIHQTRLPSGSSGQTYLSGSSLEVPAGLGGPKQRVSLSLIYSSAAELNKLDALMTTDNTDH